MFIQLTDADNGQRCDVAARWVQAVRILDQKHTEVVLGGGASLVVRESPQKVRELVRASFEGV